VGTASNSWKWAQGCLGKKFWGSIYPEYGLETKIQISPHLGKQTPLKPEVQRKAAQVKGQ